MQKHLELLTTEEYYDALIENLTRAKRRLVICAMTVELGPKLDVLLSLIDKTLDHNVKVDMVFDRYSTSMFREGRLNKKLRTDRTLDSLEHLKNKGAEVSFVGNIGPNPFAHRMHIKATVVDDDVYAFGGLNFKDISFSHDDYMIHTRDKLLLKYTLEAITRAKSGDDAADEVFGSSCGDKVLFDGGIPGKSIIYDNACRLAEDAEEVILVSRMCPSGMLARILSQKKSRCYFNRPSGAHFPTNLAIVIDSSLNRITNGYSKKAYLHSKFMLFKNPDGKKFLLSGSHNFNWRGVKYGTKEMALMSSDVDLWNRLWDYSQSLAGD